MVLLLGIAFEIYVTVGFNLDVLYSFLIYVTLSLWLHRRKKVNKKKSRQAAGVSSSALQEAHDIFGDVDELLMRRKQDRAKSSMHVESGEWSERRLEDEFDPTILAEKYMTEKDEHIRKIDVPERMQVQHRDFSVIGSYILVILLSLSLDLTS